jgi:CBS domain containing-hemolysin-like protein
VSDLSAVDPARIAPDAANPRVAEVMRPEVVFCLPSTPIDALAKLMADNDITEIPVLIDRRPVGYVCSRDILEHLVEGDVQLAGSDLVRQSDVEVLARDILRTPTLLVDEAAQLLEVIALMRQSGRTTALVMHEDESPVGMVTVREVAGHLTGQLTGGL